MKGIDQAAIDAAVARAVDVGERRGEVTGFHARRSDRRGLHPGLLAAAIGAHLLNAGTTDHALNTARARGLEAREANPVLRGLSEPDAVLYGSRALTGLATAGGAEILARKGRRTSGKLVAVAGTILPLIAAALDVTVGRRDPRRAP